MKKIIFLLLVIALAFSYNSCKKDKENGNVTFWYNSYGSDATVTIEGKTGYVTSYYPTYNPSCGSSGCANFTLEVGTHTYHASSTWSSWNGNVTVTKNGCTLVLLQ